MAETQGAGDANAEDDLRALLHRLNNQLGVILAHAELIEAKATDDVQRARANQVVTAAIEAVGVVREIRTHITTHP